MNDVITCASRSGRVVVQSALPGAARPRVRQVRVAEDDGVRTQGERPLAAEVHGPVSGDDQRGPRFDGQVESVPDALEARAAGR